MAQLTGPGAGHAWKKEKVAGRARKLLDGGDHEAAADLLLRRRSDAHNIPPGYDLLLGRALLRAGNAEAAAKYLAYARDGFGVNMLAEQRRDLAVALFQLGRFEAAGGEFSLVVKSGAKVVRAAYRAAMEAFANRAGGEPDSGPPTPHRVLVQAELLNEANDFAASFALLAEHRPSFETVPPAYDSMLGRMALRAGHREAAIAALTRARDACEPDVPANIRHQLGIALFETNHFEQAGRELDLALAAGATIGRADLRVSINAHRRRTGAGEPVDTIFARNLTLADPGRRLAYVAIPKNACSVMKANFVLNSDRRDLYLQDSGKIHEFCARHMHGLVAREIIMNSDYFKVIILRDPLRRALSAYLDKFVRGRFSADPGVLLKVSYTIGAAQAAAGIACDPARSITFEEFVRFLATADDEQMDPHWMPQLCMAGDDLSIYDHVGLAENLQETFDLLASRFGFLPAEGIATHMRKGECHITKYSETADIAEPWRALPHELDAFEQAMPVPDRFLTPELTHLLCTRFAADLMLHRAARGGD